MMSCCKHLTGASTRPEQEGDERGRVSPGPRPTRRTGAALARPRRPALCWSTARPGPTCCAAAARARSSAPRPSPRSPSLSPRPPRPRRPHSVPPWPDCPPRTATRPTSDDTRAPTSTFAPSTAQSASTSCVPPLPPPLPRLACRAAPGLTPRTPCRRPKAQSASLSLEESDRAPRSPFSSSRPRSSLTPPRSPAATKKTPTPCAPSPSRSRPCAGMSSMTASGPAGPLPPARGSTARSRNPARRAARRAAGGAKWLTSASLTGALSLPLSRAKLPVPDD